jgi:hypothetical protein
MEPMKKKIEIKSFESNEYWGENNNFKFIAKIDRFDQTTEVQATADRMVRNKFTITVKAYILPESELNRDGNRQQTTKLQHSIKKVVFNTEVVTKL